MAVDVLTLLLNMDPDKRPTAEQALQHPYFAKYHMPKDEVRTECVCVCVCVCVCLKEKKRGLGVTSVCCLWTGGYMLFYNGI